MDSQKLIIIVAFISFQHSTDSQLIFQSSYAHSSPTLDITKNARIQSIFVNLLSNYFQLQVINSFFL